MVTKPQEGAQITGHGCARPTAAAVTHSSHAHLSVPQKSH
jgi:hypothetical protein